MAAHSHHSESSSSSSSVPSLPPPCPKSPPEYPDLYGKRREIAKVQLLDREIGFLQEELKTIEGLHPASRCCKEVADFVMANSDPLIPENQKRRRSCRFWKWLCGTPCFNFSWLSWICCYSKCSIHVELPPCCDCSDCSLCDCHPCTCCCSIPKCWCCSCPRSCPRPRCCRKISCCSGDRCVFCFPFCKEDCCCCQCQCPRPRCPPRCPRPRCPRPKCPRPKCPKVSLCCSCKNNCCTCNPCCLFF